MENKTESKFETLIQLAQKFWEAKPFLVACELNIFTLLSSKVSTAPELAVKLGLDPGALEIMLDALAALDVLSKEEGRYRNTEVAETYLVCGRKGYRGNIIKHLDECWDDWSHLKQRLGDRQTASAENKPEVSPEEHVNYIWGMDDVGRERSREVLEKLDFSQVRNMLDLGGGAATYSIAIADAYPKLRATVFDLPQTLKVARENIRKHGLDDRISTKAGDFYIDVPGEGYDLVWISQVFHGQGENGCRLIIEKVYNSLKPGGRVVIHDFPISEDRTSPLRSALFALHMLAVTPQGRVYTPQEIMSLLLEAGFRRPRVVSGNARMMLIEGFKP